LSGQENLAAWHAMRSLCSGCKTGSKAHTLRGRNPGRSWLAETGRQAERDRLTCSSRQRPIGRQNQKQSSLMMAVYEVKHVVYLV
jgi:ribosomal protein L44E